MATPFDEPQATPRAVRRIGYNQRGNASPVGEPDDYPLTLGRPQDIERADEQETTALRRRYDARKQADATVQKKTRNAQAEADFRAKGQKFYTDSFGDLQPEVDETGAPRFNTTTWKKGKDATGAPALVRRNERGENEYRKPRVTAPGDVRDPNLYYNFGADGKEAAGHVDDLLRSDDPDVARIAAEHRLKRNAALRAESLKPLAESYRAAEGEFLEAQLKRTTLDSNIAKINEQIAALDSNPAIKQTAGGVFGIGAEPTAEAKRLQNQRATLQATLDDLSKQAGTLAAGIDKGGAIARKKEEAKLELDLWENRSKVGELEDLAEQRRQVLKSQGKKETDDPVLRQILDQQQAFGVRLSKTAAARFNDEQLKESGRTEGITLDLSPDQFQKRSSSFQARKALFEENVDRIARAAQEGRRGPELEAQMQQLESERRALVSEQGRLTGAQERMMEKAKAERTAAVAKMSNEELLAGLDYVSSDLAEREKAFASFSGDKRVKKETVAKVQTLRDQVKETFTLLDAERKKRGLGATQGEKRASEGNIKSLMRGIGAGASNVNAMIAGTIATGADLVGWDWLRESADEFSTAAREVATEVGPSIGSLDDVESVSSAFKYMSGQVGMQAPIFGAAKVAGLMAQGLAQIPQVARGVAVVAGTKKAGNAIEAARKASDLVNKAASIGTGVTLQTGAIRGELLDYAKEKFIQDKRAGKADGSLDDYRERYVQPLPTLTMGLATGMLEGLALGKTLQAAGLQKSAQREMFKLLESDGIGRRVLKSILAAEASEIPTELLQTLGERLAVKWVDPESDFFLKDDGSVNPELVKALRETAAATIVSTAPIGALGGIQKVTNDAAVEDAVRAIEQVAAAGRRLRDLDQWQQEELRRPGMELVPAARIAETTAAIADNPQSPQVAAALADLHARADVSLTAARQIAAAPDFVTVDPLTQQPVTDPATVGANRDATRALVKIANGYTPDSLTEAEAQGLEIIGEQLGSEMVRNVDGQSVITDKAREWAVDLVPAAGRLIKLSETERIGELSVAAQTSQQPTKGEQNEQNQEKGRQALPLTPSVAPAEQITPNQAEGASVSFTNAEGQQERVAIPAGATVPSTKAPVADQATAEQFIAETRKGAVRDVQYTPAAPKATADAAPKGDTTAASIFRSIAKPLLAKGTSKRDVAELSVKVSKAIKARSALFGGRVEVVDRTFNSGGFLYDTDRDTLIVSTADIANDADVLKSNPERLEKVIREEAIHRAAIQLEKRGDWQSRNLWTSLAPATQEAFVRAYNQGRTANEGARTTDPRAMGHEMVRMLVQGRLAVTDGKLTIDGAAISEETASPALVQRLAEILRKIRDYFTDLAGTLTREGNAPETVAEVQRVVDLVSQSLQSLEASAAASTTAAPTPAPAVTRPAPAVRPSQVAQRIAEQLGIAPDQVGTVERVTHKGRTVETVNVVIEAEQANTSHNPDGSIRADYPQELQPRDRSGAVYVEQQRRIASNPNWAEEMLTGTPDRGTPIMAVVDGQPVTVIGNGRANAKLLMYSSPDLQGVASDFQAELIQRAPEKGISSEAAGRMRHPVFARVITGEMPMAELRSFSQASNEFSGAATNALEQGRVDASRLTPGTLAFFDPQFDLDAAKNDEFRRQFVRTVIGRAENITGPDLRRRVQAALFAKAYGATEAGQTAFARLAGENDEGVKNLVRAMLDVAPDLVATQQRIADGTLYPIDIAPTLAKAVQEIAVALRDRPANQPADIALDGLVNQTELPGVASRNEFDDAVLRFLVENRRNRAELTRGLTAFVAGVYAAGDPRQVDMFGAQAPTAEAIFRTAVEDPDAADRLIAASQIGRLLGSQTAIDELEKADLEAIKEKYLGADGVAAIKAYEKQLETKVQELSSTWTPWYDRYKAEATRFANGSRAVARATDFPEPSRFYVREKPKKIGRIVEKALSEGSGRSFAEELENIKDTLGATFIIRTRADYDRALNGLIRVFDLDANRLDLKNSIAKPTPLNYRDIKIRPEIRPNVRAEVIFITPSIHDVKSHGIGHKIYELFRSISALQTANNGELPTSIEDFRVNTLIPASQALYAAAWAADEGPYLASQSARDISTSPRSPDQRITPSALSPEGFRNLTPGLPSAPTPGTTAYGTSSSSSLNVTQNRVPGGNLSGTALIAPSSIAATPSGQPPRGAFLLASQGGLFGDLLADYAAALPPKAKRKKAEAKKIVAAEIPALAANDAAFDDLFSLAQKSADTPLTGDAPANTGEQSNDPERRQPPQAPARRDGARAFNAVESDDLGSLFDYTGTSRDAADANRADGTPGGDVAGKPALQPDAVGDGQGERVGVDQAGAAPAVGTEVGSVPGATPGSGNRAGGRLDARAAAEARRLARIARSRALGVNEQNHRIQDEDALAEGGVKTRLRANIAAIQLLRTLQSEKRNATPEEKKILAKYVGWGAMPQVFDRTKGETIAKDIDDLNEQIESYEAHNRRSPYITYYADALPKLREQRDALERWDRQWGEGYRALKELLSTEEWEAARGSTENAHYTDRSVIEAMWQAARTLGFKGGRVLEPAGGVGHFFGLMPEEMMRASELFGVELDSISGGIFAALYPDAQVQVTGFESARLPDNAFDFVISNVPFSENGPVDPLHDKAKLNLHNYFFAKALDKVRPGGVVAFITTSHTMESNSRQREYIAQRGDLIGAVRLPNNAFSGNAGTEVTTDVVFLRKKQGTIVPSWAESWLTKDKVGEDQIPNPSGEGSLTVPINVNEYFARHPEMVLGRHSMNGKMYAGPSKTGQYTVFPTEGANLTAQLSAAFSKLPANVFLESGESAPIVLATTSNARNGAFSYQNGELGIQRDGTWKPLAEASPEQFGDGKIKYRRKAAQFVTLRDHYRAHLDLMARPTATEEAIAASRTTLNALYDDFVSQWRTFYDGRHSELKTDPDFYIVSGLEFVETTPNPETGKSEETVVKADVLKKRTIFPNVAPTSANNPLDALRISQSWKGSLDLEFMADLLDEEPSVVRQNLIEASLAFENPTSGQLETRETYLSGKVREKLRQAEAAVLNNPEYQRNVDALKAVQPPRVSLRDITPKLGGGWVPPALLETFLSSIGIRGVEIQYKQIGERSAWSINAPQMAKFSSANTTTYEGGGMTALEILQDALELRTPQITKTIKDGDRKRTVVDATATEQAKAAMKRLTDEWTKFARSDKEVTIMRDGASVTATVAEITADAFNEQFNGTIPRSYDGSHLSLPGSAPFLLGPAEKGGLRQHQKNGIWRAIQEGVAFLAHGVGSGKTRELITTAMEWKRLGLAKKPMLVVHNPTLNQFANEIRKTYPGARALVATKADLKKENRRAFAARVASGDWDVIVIAHSSFNLIDDKPEVIAKFIADQRAQVEEAINERLKDTGQKYEEAKKKDPTVKQLVKMLDAFEARLKKAQQLENKDDAVFFQDLGVDGLLIDEAHLFKKVPFVTKMQKVAGLDMGSSARAANLLMRLTAIRERTGGRNVVLATGTPITNTLAEIWNMIRLTSPAALKEFGVQSFDQFAANFTQTEQSYELHQATNELRARNRLKRFVNGTGLAAFVRSVMDVQMNLELGQPKIANGGLTAEVTQRTENLEAYMGYLKGLYEQWEGLDGQEKQQLSAIPIVIYGIAKAATMDMRLIDPTLPDDPKSKVNVAVSNVVKFYRQEQERKGVQIIFSDRYNQTDTSYLDEFAGGKFTPPSLEDVAEEEDTDGQEEEKKIGQFNLYEDIKRKLIAQGIPEGEIAIAMEYDSDDDRAALFAKANSGKVRVLIGSTQKLGVGVNVQERLYAMHHLDVPQTPADLEQRIGRGWRAGNRYTSWDIPIQNIAYGVERTMDAGAYQIIETKAKFSKQAISGQGGIEFDDPSGDLVDAASMLKAQFTGDPRMMERVTLENQIRALELAKDAHEARLAGFQEEIRTSAKQEAISRAKLAEATAKASRVQAVQQAGLDAATLDEIDARIDAVEVQVIADGAMQDEKARVAYSRELAQGITLTIYGSGQLNAQAQPVFRASAVMSVDGEPFQDAGITSQRSKALPDMFARATNRAQSLVDSHQNSIAHYAFKQQTAQAELNRQFEDQAELDEKRTRLANLTAELAGTLSVDSKDIRGLEEGRGPRGERQPLSLLASGRATDPNQLEFEEFTPEELAAVDRVLANATKADLVTKHVSLADKIASQFRIPGTQSDDTRQEARTALITAARQYDANKGPFAPYAGMVIRNRLRALYNREMRRPLARGVSIDAESNSGLALNNVLPAGDNTRIQAETEDTKRLLRQAMNALPPRLMAITEARMAGQLFEDIAEAQGISKQRAQALNANALRFIRAYLEQNGIRRLESDGVLASSPAEDEQAITDLMNELARDVPLDQIGMQQETAQAEAPGQQTVGRPDLANPAGPDAASRRVMNAVDAARNETLERESHEQWRTQAVAMIERDRAGVLRDLLATAQEGTALNNPVQVKAAQLLVNDLIQKAVATKDPEAMRQAQILSWSYREGGTEQARAFAARRDPFKNPADRYREFLAGAIFAPSPKLKKELRNVWSPADKQRRIASLNKQLADARAQLLNAKTAGNPVPADVQQRITKLNVALGEAIATKDRVERLNAELSAQTKRIDAELKKMGVTMDDIFSGDAYLRLRGGAIDNNIFDAANYDAIKRRALTLIKKGWSNDYIAKRTGLTAAQVSKFEDEHIAALEARLEKLGDAALDPDKLDTLNLSAGAARLASGEASLTPEQRKERIRAMINAMGYGRGAQREQRTRRATTARRKPAPTSQPTPRTPSETSETPGATPNYPSEASGRTRPNRGNRQFDLEETGQEQPPGATLPDATGRTNPYDFANEDAAPPVFDISDPVQVAQAARAIQAANSNAFDMASEFWINSILSGPLTQGANIIGNTANAVWDFTFKRAGEAVLNSFIGDSNAPQLGEFRHMMRALNPALARAWKNALRTWTAETSLFENDVLNAQLELAGDFDKTGAIRTAIPGKTGKVIRIPGRLLLATDDFFKSFIAHTEAAAQAYRIAKSEGMTGPALEARIAGLINLPGSAAWLAAVAKAEELTFQSKHEGKPASKLLTLASSAREFDIGGGIKPLRFVLPFVRTPFNIFAQGMRQSPAGMAMLLGRFAKAGFYRLKNGKPVAETYPRPEMIKHSVEQLIAWTGAALLYAAAAGDDDDENKPILITGSVPYTDPASNALNQRTGNQPYSIRVGNAIVPYGRIEPLATILGTTIDTIKARKESRRDKDSFDAFGALMQSLTQQTEEKTFLRGIGDLIGAASGERRGERESYFANFLASWVPNLLRQPLRELDPVMRERGGGFTEKLAANVVPQTASPKVDVYGETIQRPGLAAWRALVPINVRSAPDVNRIDRLLTNWYQAHPEEKWAPMPLSRTLRLNQKESRQLTSQELNEYAVRSGRMAAQMLRSASLNIEKPTEADIERIKNAFTTARTITRRQMFGARAQIESN